MKERGGIENVPSGNHAPSMNQSYKISHQLIKGMTDPLKKLREKQQRDGSTEDAIIQRIQTKSFSYDIILFNQYIIYNLTNFCCKSGKNYKSALCWGIMFDLGYFVTSLPYFGIEFSEYDFAEKSYQKVSCNLRTSVNLSSKG